MLDWIILGGYVIGIVAMARFLAPRFVDFDAKKHPNLGVDTESLIMSKVFGLLVGFFWPVVLLGLLAFYKAPRSQEQVKHDLRKREEAVQSRERYIEKLERETGVGAINNGYNKIVLELDSGFQVFKVGNSYMAAFHGEAFGTATKHKEDVWKQIEQHPLFPGE